MNNKLISVVIPTKNRLNNLQRLLRSLDNSNYQNLEIIVVNDGGEYPKISKKDVEVLSHEKSRGLAYSRTAGAKMGKGGYVLFVDDDNIIDRDMISHLVSTLEKYTEIAAVGPLTFYASNKKKIWFIGSRLNLLTSMPTFFRSYTEKDLIDKKLFLTENLHNCFMVRRELGEKVGWFDPEVFMNGTEYDLFQRIKIKYPNIKLATNVKAICYHDVPEYSKNLLRSLGFDNERRVYYFQRNRGLHVGRYGKWYEKLSLFFIFYPAFLFGYGLLFLFFRKLNFLLEHIKATIAGYRYLVRI